MKKDKPLDIQQENERLVRCGYPPIGSMLSAEEARLLRIGTAFYAVKNGTAILSMMMGVTCDDTVTVAQLEAGRFIFELNSKEDGITCFSAELVPGWALLSASNTDYNIGISVYPTQQKAAEACRIEVERANGGPIDTEDDGNFCNECGARLGDNPCEIDPDITCWDIVELNAVLSKGDPALQILK